MKRARILFAALVLLLGMVGTVFLWQTITREQENISVTIVSEMGERSKAAGLTATIHQNMGRQLYWDTTFLPDTEGYAASKFTFLQQQKPDVYDYSGDPFLVSPISLNTSMSTSGAFTLSEMGPPYDALETYLADMGENDTKTITLPLAELYPILPIECNQMDHSGFQTFYELGNYFSIPTPEELSITITAHSDAYGDITEINMSAGSEPYVTSDSVLSENGAYLVISSLPQDILLGGTYEPLSVDLSHCKDGYGIYFIPSEPFDENRDVYHIDEIEMVYPVAEDTRAVGIEKDADGNLLLFTETGRQWTLTIIDQNTMEPLQTIPLGEIGHSVNVMRISSSHDHLAIFYSKGTMHLFKKEQGQYTDGSYFSFLEDITDYHYNSLTTASGEDGRFAVFYSDPYRNQVFYLSIFEEGKQVYTATYETSLTKDSDLQWKYDNTIRLNNETALELTFS